MTEVVHDPITLEILSNALRSVADETFVALRKSAFSNNIKERADHSTALFDAKGRLIVQSQQSLPIHVGGIAGTGYMMTTDAFWGVEWVEETHETLVYMTLALVVLHVGGVILASIEHKENLVRSMFTGRKRPN